MSREIKYRVKVTWFDELRIADVTHITIGHWGHGVTTGKAFINLNGWENEYVDFEISPATGDVLMQYTGFKDKNGVEIYEGYILRLEDSELIAQVIWEDFKLRLKWATFTGFSDKIHAWADELEVIGNIYENADLLEASNEQGND